MLFLSGNILAQTERDSADNPPTATVLGEVLYTHDPEELRYYILGPLLDRYDADQGIQVEAAEIDAYLESMRQTRLADRQRQMARLAQLDRQLSNADLNDSERARLSTERDTGQSLLDTLAELEASTDEDPVAEQAARREVAAAFIRHWKRHRALYRQYGGRLVQQQTGPEPLDAYRQFLEEQQDRGDFRILDEDLARDFWRYYRDDALHDFYPPDSEAADRAFETPPW